MEYERSRYIQRQRNNFEDNVALIDATESHDQYSRATLAFAKLREQIGDKPIVLALNNLWKNHSYPRQPAHSMDFVKSLIKHSKPEHHPLINQLFLGRDTKILIE
ncbi:MAG: hypothetical protein HAW66_05660 [Shewanella sp.]|nr:hypothetical protein [Shewanella sp.]